MPTYVYRRADGTTFEIQQRITEDALTHDPETGQTVTRVPSAGAGFVLKGTGFYQTDYKPQPEETSTSTTAASTDTSSNAGAEAGTNAAGGTVTKTDTPSAD